MHSASSSGGRGGGVIMIYNNAHSSSGRGGGMYDDSKAQCVFLSKIFGGGDVITVRQSVFSDQGAGGHDGNILT